MTHELLEALKREFWPGYKEEKEKKQTSSEQEPKQEENLLEKDSAKEEQQKCDYCGNGISARAYKLHGKIICSPCLNSRFDDYTSKTFKKITNKSLEEVRKKI